MRGSWKSRSAPVARPNKSPAIGCPPRWCGSHEPGLTPNLEQEPSSHGSLSQEPEHEPSSWFRIRFEPTTGRSLCRRLSIRRSWPLRYSSTDLPQDGLPQLRALKTIAGFLNAKRGTPLIGVANAGKVLGLDVRRFPERGQYRPAPGTKLRDMVTAAADFFLTAAAPASLPRNLVRKLFFSNTRTGVGRACRTALEELFPVVTWWVWSAFVGVAARVVRVECPRSSTAGLIDH